MERPTRRHALRRGLLALGGLAGVGAARVAGVGAPAAPPGRPRLTVLTLQAPDLPAGRPAAAARAELLDAPGGRRVGEVHVAAVPVAGPGMSAPDVGVIEWHTFHLDGGTLIGSGSSGTERGAFAIVGGTGRFAGARGTYDLRRDANAGFGAEFLLRLES